ncbi:helix-turn-helix domain-containing protein [Pseudonocardia nigra]|uniref:helix-turn-helix domain-containing protein n=1 Tax=Pseudonocardia nigra TaxID=1921578 RepID=UPI003556FCF0
MTRPSTRRDQGVVPPLPTARVDGPDSEPRPGSATAGRTRVGGDQDALLPLLTPAQAAELLSVRESWLRRRATARAVPCTFLGKHLRFSRTDVRAIAAAAAQPVSPPTGSRGRNAIGSARSRGRR